MPTILLISGPNLNLLGEREPEIYGTDTLGDCVETATEAAAAGGFELEHVSSNHEGEIIDAVQAARGRAAAVVINGAAFSHYARGIADALATFDGVKVELHLTNPGARESWRRLSVLTPVVDGVVSGFGRTGYRLAIEGACALIGSQP